MLMWIKYNMEHRVVGWVSIIIKLEKRSIAGKSIIGWTQLERFFVGCKVVGCTE
jgi:hypothetical protein